MPPNTVSDMKNKNYGNPLAVLPIDGQGHHHPNEQMNVVFGQAGARASKLAVVLPPPTGGRDQAVSTVNAGRRGRRLAVALVALGSFLASSAGSAQTAGPESDLSKAVRQFREFYL